MVTPFAGIKGSAFRWRFVVGAFTGLLLALVILSKAEFTERAILHYVAALKEGEIGNKVGGG